MWFEKSVLYHIYPLGLCGVRGRADDRKPVDRISKIAQWIPHIRDLGVDAIYLGPVFESDRHGYDARDYTKIDSRLGTNDDFKRLCEELHSQGMRVILDGVFNHVGRGFWAFQDVIQNRDSSRYQTWFNIDFGGDSPYGDGLRYEGWEGHYELVKLNLRNNEVVEYIFSCIGGWVEEFDIDGLRLDVAYMLDRDFLRRLSEFARGLKPEFFLLGEMIHGDYNEIVRPGMLHSCTNYECYKGLYSSFNSMNMFEIGYSLNRQFGSENWTLYRGKHLVNFADNHDVNRLASTLVNEDHLPLLYGLMFAMPGIPCIYYGSEWGAAGEKQGGDDSALRPCFEEPIQNDLTRMISCFAECRHGNDALINGGYEQIALTNGQILFLRETAKERIFVAVNAASESAVLSSPKLYFSGEELITGRQNTLGGILELAPMSVEYWRAV